MLIQRFHCFKVIGDYITYYDTWTGKLVGEKLLTNPLAKHTKPCLEAMPKLQNYKIKQAKKTIAFQNRSARLLNEILAYFKLLAPLTGKESPPLWEEGRGSNF